MAVQTLEVLSSESLAALRQFALDGKGTELWNLSFDKLCDLLALKLVPSDYQVDRGVALRFDEPMTRARELDAVNSARMLRVLPGLTVAGAADERIWPTLALSHFRDYVHDRWRLANQNPDSHVRSHVLAGAGRARERDHALGRLWFVGNFVATHTRGDALQETLRAVYVDSDLSVQFMGGRPSLASTPVIARVVLRLCREHYGDRAQPWSRNAFRDFMDWLDLVAGGRALGVLAEEELYALCQPRFAELNTR